MISNTYCKNNSGDRSPVPPVYSRLTISVKLSYEHSFCSLGEIEPLGKLYTVSSSLFILKR